MPLIVTSFLAIALFRFCVYPDSSEFEASALVEPPPLVLDATLFFVLFETFNVTCFAKAKRVCSIDILKFIAS